MSTQPRKFALPIVLSITLMTGLVSQQAKSQPAATTAADVPELARQVADYRAPLPDRKIAATQLATLGQAAIPAIPELIRALDSDDWAFCAAVAEALAATGNAGEQALIQQLNQAPAQDRYNAAWAMARITPRIPHAADALVDALVEPDPDMRREVRTALVGLHAQAVPALARALAGKDGLVRARAAYVLSIMNPEETVPALPALLAITADHETVVREQVATALGRYTTRPSQVAPALLNFLKDPDEDVRIAAAESLPAMGASILPPVINVVADASPDQTAGILNAIRFAKSIGLTQADFLLDAIGEPDARTQAIWIITQFGPEAAGAVPALTLALNAKPAEVRKAAAFAIGAIGPTAANASDALLASLNDPELWVRAAAAGSLGQIHAATQPVFVSLSVAAIDPETQVRLRALQSLAQLDPTLSKSQNVILRSLRDNEASVRELAAQSLAHSSKTDPLIAALTECLSDPSPAVRYAAAQSLLGFHEQTDKVVATLAKLIIDPDPMVITLKVDAIRLLGQQGQNATPALDALRKAAADPNLRTRNAAVDAINAITKPATTQSAQ